MVLNPDVQRKAQDEITQVCDPNQLPLLDDVDSLPYVTAVVLEVLRWSSAVALSAPTISPRTPY